MNDQLIHEDGRLVGTRINVYNLMPYFLNHALTEAEIAERNDITPEQVAAARAYVLHHPDDVLAQHLQIEERIAIRNPPEVIEKLRKAQGVFLRCRQWIKLREELDAKALAELNAEEKIPTDYLSFRKWVAETKLPVAVGF